MGKPVSINRHEYREGWLKAAVTELRPYFEKVGHPLPDNIRLAIGFPSTGRKGKRLGECWHSESSDDNSYEIFIRPDLAEPEKILPVLMRELVHAALPTGVQHGKLFKGAAIKVGLQGKMRDAQPGELLQEHLAKVAANLGPLPHARLHIEDDPLIAVAPNRCVKRGRRSARNIASPSPSTCRPRKMAEITLDPQARLNASEGRV